MKVLCFETAEQSKFDTVAALILFYAFCVFYYMLFLGHFTVSRHDEHIRASDWYQGITGWHHGQYCNILQCITCTERLLN